MNVLWHFEKVKTIWKLWNKWTWVPKNLWTGLNYRNSSHMCEYHGLKRWGTLCIVFRNGRHLTSVGHFFFFKITSSSNFSCIGDGPISRPFYVLRHLTSKHQMASSSIPLQCRDDRFLFHPKKVSWILNCKNFLPPWKIPVNLLSNSGQQIAMEKYSQVFIKWNKHWLAIFWNWRTSDWVSKLGFSKNAALKHQLLWNN